MYKMLIDCIIYDILSKCRHETNTAALCAYLYAVNKLKQLAFCVELIEKGNKDYD